VGSRGEAIIKREGAAMKYDRIGIGYDTTRRADPRIAERLLALLTPTSGGLYLDIGCGTGNYTHALHSQGLDVVGIDQSAVMLDTARAKYPTIAWHQADVTDAALPDARFDGAVCTKPSTAFLISMRHSTRSPRTQPRSPGRADIDTRSNALVLVERVLSQRDGSAQSISCHPIGSFGLRSRTHSRVIGTEPWFVPNDPVDLFLYSVKHNPTIYLDERVRQGISTFANLAERDEVEQGLIRLKEDIATGKIRELHARYTSNDGDYLFIVAQLVLG
jgi:SAM-dependent methyltransferase